MAFDSFQLLTPAICSTVKNLFMTTFLIGLFGPNWPDSDEIDAKGCSGVNKKHLHCGCSQWNNKAMNPWAGIPAEEALVTLLKQH